MVIACGPSLCVSLYLVDLGREEALVFSLHFPERVKHNVHCLCAQLHSPSCEVHVGSACLSSLRSSPTAQPRARQAGMGVQGTRNSQGGRNLEHPSQTLPLSTSRSGCPVRPAPSDSAPGSQAEPERERWRRPGTCRATFVLGADCGRQRAEPSGPGIKGARACAQPWEPGLLPVPAS